MTGQEDKIDTNRKKGRQSRNDGKEKPRLNLNKYHVAPVFPVKEYHLFLIQQLALPAHGMPNFLFVYLAA